MTLPVPHTSRWQPLRLGLVDLFYYDQQEFHFRDGRLLLRGNNGTGKSKVLALSLPFLLDGDLTPSRVEPDGDRGKRMEWNLLLGGQYDERTGYTWLEFGRTAEDGERCYLTIGCGLKAVAGRGIADRWYFLTSRRVGEDLALIGPTGTVLTRDRLTEALGEHGQVTQKAEQYRRTVDEHLFQLGQERYDALVNLLIQLRQPQLSKQPKEELLSRALSEALAPLDQAVLADIAASFHDLEQQRDELAALRDTRGHVTRFLTRYRHYARTAARRAGRELRRAQSAYEEIGRQLGAVREEITEALDAEQTAAAERAAMTGELVELIAAREELAARPELKSIDDARRLAEATTKAATEARRGLDRARSRHNERRDRSERARAAAVRTRGAVAASLAAAGDAARAAGVHDAHGSVLAPLDLPDGPAGAGIDDAALEVATRGLGDLDRRREQEARHVLGLAEGADRRQAELTGAQRTLADREVARDAEADRAEAATAAVTQAATTYVEAWQRYAAGAAELRLPLADELGLAGWAAILTGENPAATALRRAQAAAHQELARVLAAAEQDAAAREAVLAELVAERERLESGQVQAPPQPHSRGAGVRDGRAGAPLWRVTDFAADLPAGDRAGLEAALESSGLLDAWLTPDGRLLDPDRHDTVVTAGLALHGSHLGTVLRPAVDPTVDVPARTVAAVLAGIGYGASAATAWVDSAGRWRLGPLRGAWAKPAAEYVGAGAREQARLRRLADLAGEITTAETALSTARSTIEELRGRQRTLTAEAAAAPTDEPLREAHRAAAGAVAALAQAQRQVIAQHGVVEQAAAAATEAAYARDDAAAQLRTPTATEGLRELVDAVAGHRSAVVTLLADVRLHGAGLAEVREWAAELSQAEADLREAAEVAAEAVEAERAAGSRLATLEGSLGATVAELKATLAQTIARIDALKAAERRLERAERDHGERRAKAQGREERLRSESEQEQARRNAAVRAFQRFAATGLLAVAVPELDVPALGGEWAADPAVRLARRMEPLLTDVDDGDEAWRRAQDDITRRHTELGESLSRHGHHAMAGLDDGLFVATVLFQGRSRTPDELAGLLGEEIDYRERMLTAKERELIEEHLINDVASGLQQLIADAEEQLSAVNAELDGRPTSTGMRLRLRWEPRPDGPTGLPEARSRLLRQSAELWSPDDRAAVGDFLQRQIQAERARDEYGTWGDHLRRALDYRAWHRFVIERWQDGRWRPATGPASGGERVLAASVPLFAAASAHYRSAHRHAPRLVMLDEAFAGVDDDSRAKCLGLLAHFDLDVVMTSEREWGFYATVPGIATHQLVRRDGIDAVHVTTWEWDGVSRHEVRPAVPSQPAGGSALPAGAPAGEDGSGLW